MNACPLRRTASKSFPIFYPLPYAPLESGRRTLYIQTDTAKAQESEMKTGAGGKQVGKIGRGSERDALRTLRAARTGNYSGLSFFLQVRITTAAGYWRL